MTTTAASRVSAGRGSARVIAPRHRRRRLLVVLLAPAVLAGLGWILLGSGLLSVHRVTVAGTDRLSAQQVRALAAIRPGKPLLLLDGAAVGRRVRSDPHVAAVSVRRNWPSTVSIRVTERAPVAVTAGTDGGRLVDAGGLAFAGRDERAPAGLPVLQVARVAPDDPTARTALAVLVGLPPQLRARVEAVAAATPASVRLRLKGGVDVIWGGPGGGLRKARVVEVLLGQQPAPGSIDVSAPDVATTRPEHSADAGAGSTPSASP